MSLIGRIFRRSRSAITGRFVSVSFAKHNPRTTVSEKVGAAGLAERYKREAGIGRDDEH